jgi:hypothetical protein
MSASPAIHAKAQRLLLAGRVVITCEVDGITATVSGDNGTYRLLLTESGWRCPCPARGLCAHVVATEKTTGWRRG